MSNTAKKNLAVAKLGAFEADRCATQAKRQLAECKAAAERGDFVNADIRAKNANRDADNGLESMCNAVSAMKAEVRARGREAALLIAVVANEAMISSEIAQAAADMADAYAGNV